jgi:hypothetical protein
MKGGATIEGAMCGRGVARRAKWVEQGRPKPKKQGRRSKVVVWMTTVP